MKLRDKNLRIFHLSRDAGHRSLDLFEFRTVTPDEVRTVILSSPSNKAPGVDIVF